MQLIQDKPAGIILKTINRDRDLVLALRRYNAEACMIGHDNITYYAEPFLLQDIKEIVNRCMRRWRQLGKAIYNR